MKPTATERFRPEEALVLVLGLALPFANFPLFSFGSLRVDVAHLSGGLLVLAAAARLAWRGRSAPAPRLVAGAGALLVVPLVPFLFRRLPGFSVGHFARTWIHLAFLLAVFLAIASTEVSLEGLRRIFRILALEATALAVYGIWQVAAFACGWWTGVNLLNRLGAKPLRGLFERTWRATSILEEPKWLAIQLGFGLCCATALIFFAVQERRPRERNRWVLAAFVIAAGALATASFGGVPTMLVLCGFSWLLALRCWGSRRAWILSIGAVLVLTGALSAWVTVSKSGFAEAVRARIRYQMTWGRDALGPRSAPAWAYIQNLQFGLKAFGQSPVFGIGVGQFSAVGAVLGPQWNISAEMTKDGPWIGYGGILAEFGLVGAGAFAFLLFTIVRRADLLCSERAPYCALVLLLVTAVVLKEMSAGFYVHFWTWYPLGLAALAGGARMPSASEAA